MGLPSRLLFIEPRQPASPIPVIDAPTRKMCASYRNARRSNYGYGGIHSCCCGATSSSCDYHLPSGDLTNSLCVHYVAHHRAEVEQWQLERIGRFTDGEADPDEQELQGPEYLFLKIRDRVEHRLGPDRLRTWRAWGLDVDALSLALRGGGLPAPDIDTPARRDAEDLYGLLRLITPEALPRVRAAAVRSHGDPARWGAEALRVPAWDRAAWISPLADVLQLPENVLGRTRRLILFYFRDLLEFIIKN